MGGICMLKQWEKTERPTDAKLEERRRKHGENAGAAA